MATTGIVKGGKIRLSLDGTTVAKTTSGNIAFSSSTEQIQHDDNVGTSLWDEIDITQISATVSAEAFYAEAEQFETIWTAFSTGATITDLKVATSESGDKNFNGDFKVTACSLDYSTTERAKFSATFQSVGEITRGTNA